MTDVVLVEVADGVATVTLNRPEARNALSRELLRELPRALAEADADPEVAAVVLTGSDPAFCAGLDLREVGGGELELGSSGAAGGTDEAAQSRRGPVRPRTKPLIGAVNGATVTGGLEVALACDFLIASERARFADTHARVGIQPGWGLTVLLPQWIGIPRARQMSTTGNFVDAPTALAWGLVNQVVAHDDLLSTAQGLARDVASNDGPAVQRILQTYREGFSELTGADAWALEARVAADWQRDFDPTEVARRREAIQQRGRSQQS